MPEAWSRRDKSDVIQCQTHLVHEVRLWNKQQSFVSSETHHN